jgi:hypothetical protein
MTDESICRTINVPEDRLVTIRIEGFEGSNSVKLESTKTRGMDVYPFAASFNYELDENGDLKTARFYGLPAEDNKSDRAIEREIISSLGPGEMNQKSLIMAVKNTLTTINDARIRNSILKMAGMNQITEKRGAHNASIYSHI